MCVYVCVWCACVCCEKVCVGGVRPRVVREHGRSWADGVREETLVLVKKIDETGEDQYMARAEEIFGVGRGNMCCEEICSVV